MATVKRTTLGSMVTWLLLAIGALISVFPFFWMAVGMTLKPNDVVRGIIVPGSQLMVNIGKATKNYNMPLFFFNSMLIAVVTVGSGIAVNAMAAFGFEKYRSKSREWIFALFLLTLIIPQIAVVIPLFKLIAYFKLLDSHLAIILPSIMSVFIIFFLRQNFRMFPTEIIEAARVDGAGEFRIFGSIVLPSMRASFVSAGIYMFINQWNNYLWPLMTILTDAKKTLPIAMSSMMKAYTIEYGGLMVIVCISIMPVLILFLAMQKQFVAGLLGSVKA